MNIVKINNKKKNHEKILDNDEIMMFVDGMFKDKIGCTSLTFSIESSLIFDCIYLFEL